MNLHYGCGLEAPPNWRNYDASATLYLQRIPAVGAIFSRVLKPRFHSSVYYGDIVRGLDIPDESCDLAFCSHVLEHLSLEDFRIAIRNTFRYLKPGGVFRLVIPDLEESARFYLDAQDSQAAVRFIRRTGLGRMSRPRGLVLRIKELFSTEHHLWMWDLKSLREELETAGFCWIRRCQFGDAKNPAFTLVEDSSRFEGSLEIECSKPAN